MRLSHQFRRFSNRFWWTTVFSVQICRNREKIKESIDAQGAVKKITKTAGLVWVLYGNPYILQNSAKLDIKVGERFLARDTIANQRIINNYSGIVNFDNLLSNQEINVINSAMIVENGIYSKTSNDFVRFELIWNVYIRLTVLLSWSSIKLRTVK